MKWSRSSLVLALVALVVAGATPAAVGQSGGAGKTLVMALDQSDV